jgi:DNA-binding CsgD family transcriptional regulator
MTPEIQGDSRLRREYGPFRGAGAHPAARKAFMRTIDDDVTATDLHAVLDALGRLHEADTPGAFTVLLAEELAELIPYDLADWGGLIEAHLDSGRDDFVALLHAPARPAPGPAPDAGAIPPVEHRLAMSVATGRRVFGFVLGRTTTAFARRDRAIAELIQVHLGAAFEHARLRAGERERLGALAELTGREQEVLALVADGWTNRQIGHALFIQPRTVEKHVENIRAKLGARSRAEAAAKWAATPVVAQRSVVGVP